LFPRGQRKQRSTERKSLRGTLAKSGVASGGAQSKSSVASVKVYNDHPFVWHCDSNQKDKTKFKLSMLGATLNCSGVGKKGTSIILLDPLREQELDFVGLQETMNKDYSPHFFRKIDHMNCFEWRWISSVGRSGGILGGFRLSRFDICKTGVGRFHIKVFFMDLKLQLKWNLVIFS
jgi:hypothetical protein